MPITYCKPRIKTPNHLHGYATSLRYAPPFWQQTESGALPVGTIHWIWGFVIFLNSICIGIETQQSINRDLLPGWPGEALIHSRFWCSHFLIGWGCCLAVWQAIDYVFISIYLLEILLRVFAFGAANLRDGWLLIWTNPVIEATTSEQ